MTNLFIPLIVISIIGYGLIKKIDIYHKIIRNVYITNNR